MALARLKEIGSKICDVALEALWPTRCAVCDVPGELLCAKCEAKLMPIDTCFACPKCGAPYGVFECTECNGFNRNKNPGAFESIDAGAHAVIANDTAQRLIATYKDRDEIRLAPIIASYLARYINPSWVENAVISYIPDSKRAYTRRGFDHMELIARELSKITGLACVNIFHRPKNADMRKLNRSARAKNIAGSFHVRNVAVLKEDVILIDDISTTGATLLAAAKEIAEVRKREGFEGRTYILTFGKVLD